MVGGSLIPRLCEGEPGHEARGRGEALPYMRWYYLCFDSTALSELLADCDGQR